MIKTVSILGVLLVATTMGLALAHALELPGKLRLAKDTYVAVQAIYYPGFTIGGLVGELGGLLVLFALLFLTPYGSHRFWWTAAAFGLLLATHAVYWLVTHPVNNFWVRDTDMAGAGAAFFSFLAGKGGDWAQMRDVWEYSHVARACLAMLSLASMAIALTL